MPLVGALAGILGKRLFPKNIVFGNIVHGLPIADNSADAAYSSHVLEHLGRDDAEIALVNTFRMLKPGGVFRMIVPDLQWRAARYLHDQKARDDKAADVFIASLHMGVRGRPRGLLAPLRATFGNSRHYWFYDAALMTELLSKAGFVNIRRCTFHDSSDQMFRSVEAMDRFFDDGEAECALEAHKP